MNSCYVLTLITFGVLSLAFAQSLWYFPIFKANHLTFMILTSIVYFFTETLVIFFYVGTGVSIKEYVLEHHLSDDYRRRSFQIKRKVYPPLLMNMLYMSVLFVLVGAVDTGKFPVWAYRLLFLFCIVDYMRIKLISRENTPELNAD